MADEPLIDREQVTIALTLLADILAELRYVATLLEDDGGEEEEEAHRP